MITALYRGIKRSSIVYIWQSVEERSHTLNGWFSSSMKPKKGLNPCTGLESHVVSFIKR